MIAPTQQELIRREQLAKAHQQRDYFNARWMHAGRDRLTAKETTEAMEGFYSAERLIAALSRPVICQ